MMTGEETWSYVQPVLIDAIRDKRLPGAAYMTVNKALMAMDRNGLERTGTDLISRQEAIDEIEGVDWYHQNKKGEMVHGANSKEHQPWYKSQDIYKALKAVPAVDAIPVIRCKDCRYWDEFPSSSVAPEFHECKGLGVHTVAGFFCSKGERTNE